MSLPSPTSSPPISTYQSQTKPPLSLEVTQSSFLAWTSRFQLICQAQRELNASVDSASVRHRQKVHLYIAGISPYLSWLLIIKMLPITLVQRHLEATATQFAKMWAGLQKSANIWLLYHSLKMGIYLPFVYSINISMSTDILQPDFI